MALLKLALVVLLILFVVSAIFGFVAFMIDIIRYPQKHEKVKIVSSAELAIQDETKNGLVLDEKISIFGGEKNESDN